GSPRGSTRPTRFPRGSECIVGPVPSPGCFFTGLVTVLFFQSLQEALEGEISAGTAGVNRIDLLMGPHRVRTQAATGEQAFHQRMEALQLFSGGTVLIEVSHQADSDGLLVERLAGQMAAVELRAPAVADRDFAVLHRMAVADDKMVSEPVFHVPLDAMIIVHAFDAGVGRGAVMNHDVFPFARLDANSVQRGGQE